MLCLLLHATVSDIDKCVVPESCNFINLRYQYRCVNVPGAYYCVSVSDHMSRIKVIIIGMSFYPLNLQANLKELMVMFNKFSKNFKVSFSLITTCQCKQTYFVTE